MATKKTLQAFNVWADIKITVTATVQAESLEAAISQARALQMEDFVTIKPNEWIDGEHTVTGVLVA